MVSQTATPNALPPVRDFDPAQLRRRYAQERERRLRSDGNEQYRSIKQGFAELLSDPNADPHFRRNPVAREMEVLVIGGGFSGLLAAARLRMAGYEDICIIDRASDFGGTWYWNRYPGAACDTESYIYLPLLEETGYIPQGKYAFGPEILAHSQRLGRHFDLYHSALFQTSITHMKWLDEASRWLVQTDRQDQLRARFVVLAGGPLNLPKLPGVPGIERFKGHRFHTSRWDYAYTGGNSQGGLTGLADKRVGIIGTGATAVQCVPHLAASAKELYVFQRTPSSVDVRNNQATDSDWVKTLKPGWQSERMLNFTTVISGGKFEVDLVNDGWTDLITSILLTKPPPLAPGETPPTTEELIQLADYQKMERVRARIDAVIQDRATAEALKPWYNQFCKRPCFHDEYLQAFNRPSTHLVDTAGKGVERVTENGVVVAGREYALDCLIFSTGFEVGTDFTQRLGFEIEGRDGLTLTEKFKQGTQTFHGLYSRGFPNLFIMSTSQSGQSANFQHMLAEQAIHIGYVLKQARERKLDGQTIRVVETSQEAEAKWVATIMKYANTRRKYLDECTPGYYNNEGQFNERTLRNNQFWRGPTVFLRIMDEWRRDGNLVGLELTT